MSRDFTTTGTPVGVTVGTTSVQVLPNRGADRVYAAIVNAGTSPVFLALGQTAVLNAGIYLAPNGGSYEITEDNYFTGAINAISSVAGQTVTAQEGFNQTP